MNKKPRKITSKKIEEEEFPEEEKIKKIKIRVIGIGGGAGNIVSEISQKIKKATFLVADTDTKSLKSLSRKVDKFHFGQNFTQGLGSGMDPELGELAVKEEKEKIKKLMEGQDFMILVACLGGGIGSGAASLFAKTSHSLGNLTYGIFTLPFNFEGERKMEIAKDSLRKIRGYLNAFSVLPNERIFKIVDKSTPLNDALSVINKKLAESIESLIEIIYNPGLINIDYADLKTVFEGTGKLTYLNSILAEKKETKDIVEDLLNSPLYPYSIEGAKGILLNISGPKDLSLTEVSQISQLVSNVAYQEAKIIFGISRAAQSERTRISLLATDCSKKLFPENSPKIAEQPKPSLKEKKAKTKIKKKPKKENQPKKPKKAKKEKRVKNQKNNPPKAPKIELLPKVINPPKENEKEEPEIQHLNLFKSRKNALDVKKAVEEEEAKMLAKEKFWEVPTFLRKKLIKDQ